MRTPEGDLSKLPKWAQSYITVLARDIEGLEYKLSQVSNADSAVTWQMLDGKVGIPKEAYVEFKTSKGIISISLKDEWIEIHSPSGKIMVVPIVSNSVSLSVIPR